MLGIFPFATSPKSLWMVPNVFHSFALNYNTNRNNIVRKSLVIYATQLAGGFLSEDIMRYSFRVISRNTFFSIQHSLRMFLINKKIVLAEN